MGVTIATATLTDAIGIGMFGFRRSARTSEATRRTLSNFSRRTAGPGPQSRPRPTFSQLGSNPIFVRPRLGRDRQIARRRALQVAVELQPVPVCIAHVELAGAPSRVGDGSAVGQLAELVRQPIDVVHRES